MSQNVVVNIRSNEKIIKPDPVDEEVMYDGGAMITETDSSGIITYANRKFVEMTGFSRGELIGAPHSINRHPDMPKVAFKEMWQTIKSGEMWQGIVKNLRKDGKYYWVDVWVQAKHDDKGNLIGYIAGRKVPAHEDVKYARELYKKLRSEEEREPAKKSIILATMSLDEFLDVIQKEKKRLFTCNRYVKALTHSVDTEVSDDYFGDEETFCSVFSDAVKQLETVPFDANLLKEIEENYKVIYTLYKQIHIIYSQSEVSNSNKIVAKSHYESIAKNITLLMQQLNSLESQCLEAMFA